MTVVYIPWAAEATEKFARTRDDPSLSLLCIKWSWGAGRMRVVRTGLQTAGKAYLVLGAVHSLPVFALESSRHEHPSVEPVVTNQHRTMSLCVQ